MADKSPSAQLTLVFSTKDLCAKTAKCVLHDGHAVKCWPK